MTSTYPTAGGGVSSGAACVVFTVHCALCTVHCAACVVFTVYCAFFLHSGPVYWDLTLPMFVLQLFNIVYDTPRDRLGLVAMQDIHFYGSGMTKE